MKKGMLFITNIKRNRVVVNGRIIEFDSKERCVSELKNKWGKNFLVYITEV